MNIAARLESLAEPGGICISRAAHDQARGKLSLQYEYLGEQTVKNIDHPVRVYRVLSVPGAAAHRVASAKRALGLSWRKAVLAAIVVVLLAGAGIGGWRLTRSPEDPILAMPTGPTIAVLPFTNLSGDPGQDYFSDGITEEIITELARFKDLHVLSRTSTFQYKGKPVDVRQVGQELGALYVLEGSVRNSGEHIRITAQLLDATNGAHVWAETYDRPLTPADIFAVQDEIKVRIVAKIAGGWGAIARAGWESAKRQPAGNLDAYECVIRAIAYQRLQLPNEHLEARSCLEKALEKEAGYAEGWAWLANMYAHEYMFGYNARPDPLGRAFTAAHRALALAPGNQDAEAALAQVLYLRKDPAFFDRGERTLGLNPNDPFVVGWIGLYFSWAGRVERGLALCKKAQALSPDHAGWLNLAFQYYHYGRKEYDQAIIYALRLDRPGFFWYHVALAIDYGQLGRHAEAKAAVADLLKVYPNFGAHAREEFRKWFWEEELTEHAIRGLRKAGLEVPDEKQTVGGKQ